MKDFKRGRFMMLLLSFGWDEAPADFFTYGSYSRAKPAGAQFKQLQNETSEFLQNFCFDPGVRRYKIKEVMSQEQRVTNETLSIRASASRIQHPSSGIAASVKRVSRMDPQKGRGSSIRHETR
jgi:hypothetical protein